ncbi:MAG: extracellular solute-binding protein, partial [Clostridiaceae bacterium]|nr:extracellular solute-binding protein [Clostridiaceae bacterium]
LTLRVLLTKSPHVFSYKAGQNHLTDWLQERTNVSVEFLLYEEGEAAAQLEADLSAGADTGDLILIQMDRATLYRRGSQGALLPLNDWIDWYGYGMKECLDAFPGSREAITAPDGNIYAFPKGNLVGLYPFAYAMRHWILTDFLDKYEEATGKGMPATTDEYYAYIKWCVENDPNGNGCADEVGWTGAEKRSVWYARPTDFLMNAFTLTNQDGYYQQDDVIHCAMVEDSYREGLKYLSKLMEEGLMDPNYPTNDENAIKTLVALEDGRTVASGSWGGMHNAATDHRIRNDYEIVAPLQGPDGFRNSFYDHYATGVSPGIATIPATSSKPTLAVAWMDTMYDQEVYWRGRYGEKDVDWIVPPAGTRAVDGGPALYAWITINHSPSYSYWSPTWTPGMWNRYGSYTTQAQPATDRIGNPIHDLELSLYNATRLYEEYVIPCALPPFWFEPDMVEQCAQWKQSIDAYCRQAITAFILGERDVRDDAEWDAFVAGARSLGLEEYLAAMQTEYDALWRGTLPEVYVKRPVRTA